MKKTKFKPTNMDRDKAIAHILGQVQGLEELVTAQMKALDMFIKFDDRVEKFNEFYTKEMEARLEEQKAKSGNGQALVENQEDEG